MELIRHQPCVYFISDGQGHCKIGVASDIKERLSTLQVSSAFELTIKHIEYTDDLDEAYEIERHYHSQLHERRIRGEWFDEDAVGYYLENGRAEGKTYMCDECEEFNIRDAMKLYSILLVSKTREEALEAYNKFMPDYWKEYDKRKGRDPIAGFPILKNG